MIEEITRNNEWVKANLTDKEFDLLAEHTRNPGVWTSPGAEMQLDALLDRIPPTASDLVLYSGGEIPLGNFTFSTGPINLPYFTSSYDRAVAEGYARSSQGPESASLFVLSVPVGSKIICLDTVSCHGDKEKEVLLSGQATLTVTGIQAEEDFMVVYANYKR